MGIISIIMFLIQYGPAIVKLILAALELIKWLREHDTVALGTESQVKEHIVGMAERCKRTKDRAELERYVERLKARKAEVLRSKGD